MRPRVVVIYHFYPHYRKPIIEALAASQSVDFTFVGDDHEYLHSIEPAKLSARVRFRLAPTYRLFGPFMWQWGAIKWAIKPGFDTVIMHSVPHWPCTWVGAVLARLLGRRVFFWGHGYLYEPVGVKGLLRRIFYAIPSGHLFYGQRSKSIAVRHGWPPDKLHVIYNSLDLSHQHAIRGEVTQERIRAVRKEIFGDEHTIAAICTTRLIAIRRIDLLIDAIELLKERGVAMALILVGDGPERGALEAKANRCRVKIHFEGACYDERRIAELIMASRVTVAPGKVGLTGLHSMAYGIPVISNDDVDSQMPEWEAIIPGKTGSVFKAGDVRSLADAILHWVQRDVDTHQTRDYCDRLMRRYWNSEFQQSAIERAILRGPADDLIDIPRGPA